MSQPAVTESTVRPRENGVRIAVVVAAGFSAAMAIIYLLIGLKAITVLDPPDDQPQFGLIAAGFFAAVTIVILAIRRRWVWIVLVAIQVFVAYTYVNLAGERNPDFETWGILLRVLQVPVVVALGWLILRAPRRSEEAAAID